MIDLLLNYVVWAAIFGLLYSYVLYPFLLKLASRGAKQNDRCFDVDDTNLPVVSVVISVYNEERVLRKKIDSILAQSYPLNRIEIFIGSDKSSDNSNKIIADYAQRHSNIHFYPYAIRRGKPQVLNDLVEEVFGKKPASEEHILLLTDANVIIGEDTLFHLVKHFKNPQIDLVDSNMINQGLSKDGISESENTYISNEVMLKYREGLLWKKMMGPFGGCYALRSTAFTPVPRNFLVDDFYICMQTLKKGGGTMNELKALAYEKVPHSIVEEYKRKRRISAGNFQNLWVFRSLLGRPFSTLGFTFISHKVLRWLGPIFILIAFIGSAILTFRGNKVQLLLFLIMAVGLIAIPMIERVLNRLRINLQILRNITYFNAMNVALLNGFINFLKGIQSNVWEPPKRNE